MSATRPGFAHLADVLDPAAAPSGSGAGCHLCDLAWALVVTARSTDPDPRAEHLAETALKRVIEPGGHDPGPGPGHGHDPRSSGDCWGRSLWGLGTATARSPHTWVRQAALDHFEQGALRRSSSLRAMSFAALGASEVLDSRPGHPQAIALLVCLADMFSFLVPGPSPDAGWPWPEDRLTYVNAVVPEALIVAGAALGRDRLHTTGLDLLAWLLDRETASGGHLSVTPAGGTGRDDRGPRFDQRPVEVAALADACARAARVTGDTRWVRGVERAVAWFQGDNDTGAAMWDPATSAAHDALRADCGRSGQGAEATLALLSTFQQARALGL
jgi:hypothetical protein